MNFSFVFSFLGILSLFTLISCGGGTEKEGEKPFQIEQIEGNWQVTTAQRDGQSTETLDGLFFRFSKDGKLSTNLLGADQETPFELSGNKILQKSDPPLEYTIEDLSDNELTLSTSLEEMDFRLVLGKGE